VAAHIYVPSVSWIPGRANGVSGKFQRPTAGQALFLYALAFVLLYSCGCFAATSLVLGLLASDGRPSGPGGVFAVFTRRSLADLLRIVRPPPRCLAGAALVA